MNIYYAKTTLYAYPVIEGVIEQIDDIIEKRALGSMTDFSPAEEQCEKILTLISQKDSLIKLKLILDEILDKFSPDEIDCLDYKYFRYHFHDKSYYENFDYLSRAYFRKQIKVAEKFAKRLENKGITDEVFKREFLSTDFFLELLKRVIEHETNCQKNKSKKEIVSSKKTHIGEKLPYKRTYKEVKKVAVSDSKINRYS